VNNYKEVGFSVLTCPDCGAEIPISSRKDLDWIKRLGNRFREFEKRRKEIESNWKCYAWVYWIGGLLVVGTIIWLIGGVSGIFALVLFYLGHLTILGLFRRENSKVFNEIFRKPE
jgi:hypothetical protein